MRDYKAHPGPKGRKPPRLSRQSRLQRSRPPVQGTLNTRALNALARGERNGPAHLSVLVRALRRLTHWPLGTVAFVVALGWLLTGLAVGGYALWQAPLQEVELAGNRAVTGETVLRLAGLEAGLSMYAIDPFETARRLRAHPRIVAADVRRVYPGRLAIRVQERQAEMRVRLRDGRTALVDRENYVLSVLGTQAALPPDVAQLPLLVGTTAAAETGQSLLDAGIVRGRAALVALRELDFPAPERTVVDAGDPFLLWLGLPDGARLIVPIDQLEPALRTYREVAERYPTVFEPGRTIDLTTLSAEGGRIVLRRP